MDSEITPWWRVWVLEYVAIHNCVCVCVVRRGNAGGHNVYEYSGYYLTIWWTIILDRRELLQQQPSLMQPPWAYRCNTGHFPQSCKAVKQVCFPWSENGFLFLTCVEYVSFSPVLLCFCVWRFPRNRVTETLHVNLSTCKPPPWLRASVKCFTLSHFSLIYTYHPHGMYCQHHQPSSSTGTTVTVPASTFAPARKEMRTSPYGVKFNSTSVGIR